METKCSKKRAETVAMHLGFQYSFIIEPVGLQGGLLLLWKIEVDISVDFHSIVIIGVSCTSLDGFRWRL